MLRAELVWVSPNDHRSWDDFAASEIPDPWDHFEWFQFDIGSEGDKGSETFQALVTTPLAKQRARNASSVQRVLVVHSFQPESLAEELREYASSITGRTWEEIRERLQRDMYWEYE
jgi:hypothetical protein